MLHGWPVKEPFILRIRGLEIFMQHTKVPTKFKPVINKAISLLLSEYKDTRGICLIGSIADGTHNKSSDLDLVWIKSHRINYKKLFKIKEELSFNNNLRVQLIPFTSREVLWHFNRSSTMAHSIQKGIVIYGKRDSLILSLLKKKLSSPSKEWMEYWFEHWLKRYQWARDSVKREKGFHKKFCKTKCGCNIVDDIARVTVNFAILLLEIHQIVPLSKTQIIKNIEKYSPALSNNVLKGLKLALKFSGKDRFLTLKEADKILFSANWLKRKLSKALGKPGKDYEKVFNL